MKPTAVLFLFLCGAFELEAAPVTLVSVLSDRPVFSYVSAGLTQTRTLSPGNRISLEAGTFSGLGVKKARLSEGSIYYLARFGAAPGLFVLGPGQVLILNQSGQAVSVVLSGQPSVSGTLASGSFALAAAVRDQLSIEWQDGAGERQTRSLQGGKVYRFLLDSPEQEGVGIVISLAPWD